MIVFTRVCIRCGLNRIARSTRKRSKGAFALVSQKALTFFGVAVAGLLLWYFGILIPAMDTFWVGVVNAVAWAGLNWWWLVPSVAVVGYVFWRYMQQQRVTRNANIDYDEAWKQLKEYSRKGDDTGLRWLVANLTHYFYPPQVFSSDLQQPSGSFFLLFEASSNFVPRPFERRVVVVLKAGAIPQPFSKSRVIGWGNFNDFMLFYGARKLGDIQFQSMGAVDYKGWWLHQIDADASLADSLPIPEWSKGGNQQLLPQPPRG